MMTPIWSVLRSGTCPSQATCVISSTTIRPLNQQTANLSSLSATLIRVRRTSKAGHTQSSHSGSTFQCLHRRFYSFHSTSSESKNSKSHSNRNQWHGRTRFHTHTSPPSRDGRRLIFSSAGAGTALTPAVLMSISEDDSEDDGLTGEEHMLAASREELNEELPSWIAHTNKGWRRSVYLFVDSYIIEPAATTLRFLHLVFIFVPVVLTVPVIWLGREVKERDNERSGTLWWYGFLVSSMERAGAAFIKLGQWAASRTDIFPKEMCNIMAALHSNAPAHSLSKTKKIIERAFDGRNFNEIFEEFQEKPLGVGAIAQVYKAKLQPDLVASHDADVTDSQKPSLTQRVRKNVDVLAKSTPQRIPSSYVAIKVLHPNVERIVRRDLRIMTFFANIVNAIPTMEWFSFPDQIYQFGEMMRLQMDLRIEAANLSIFRKKFKDRTTAWFPYPYSDYTTRQVLIEEFAQGIPLAAFLEDGGGVFQSDIADEGLNAFLHMVLIDNFIHADLHPGNIMVRFLQPARITVPPSIDVISRTRYLFQNQAPSILSPPPTSTSPASGASGEGEITQLEPEKDVTEQVLARLRPHRHDPKSWTQELAAIDKEGYRPQLIFIDTGLVTELNANNRKNFLDLFKAVAEFDGYKAGHLMIERCRQPDAVVDPEVFALRMQHLVLGVKSRTFALGNIKIGDVLSEVLDMVRSHHVRLEGDFVNVVLSILLLEGIGRRLDPNLDLFAGALPILRRLGSQGGAGMLKRGDFSMIKVWVGLEARRLVTVSVEEVERCVKYDQLSPNI